MNQQLDLVAPKSRYASKIHPWLPPQLPVLPSANRLLIPWLLRDRVKPSDWSTRPPTDCCCCRPHMHRAHC